MKNYQRVCLLYLAPSPAILCYCWSLDNNTGWNNIFFYFLCLCYIELRLILFLVPQQFIVINKYSEIEAVRSLLGFYRGNSYSAHSKEEKKYRKTTLEQHVHGIITNIISHR